MAKLLRRVIRSHAHTLKAKKVVSANALFLIIAGTVILGFFVGTQSNQIMAFIGPVFGIKTYAGNIDLSSLQATYQALKANYDGKLSDQTLIDGANKGMVAAAGDTYTLFMNAKDAATFADDLSGNIGGGIGAEISIRSGKVTIIGVLKGDPAVNAGLQAGDTVLTINDESTTGMTVDQAVAKIRGDVGTTVKISISRAGETKDFTVTRATITSPSVTSSVAGGIGTLTISRFDSETSSLARAAAQDFKTQGVKAIILDLRDNGGGYVDAAQDVLGLWLDNKVVVTERTNGQVVSTLKSGSNALLAGLPTVVLVNGSSASASEIVAGALQDYKVAKLVGVKTFGKGSVQKLIDLPDGAELKVTIARWYTPNGKNITTQGITPDITATLTQADSDAGKDPQLDAAKKELGL
ncbi:MAG: putative carboxyl-terminal protease [Candidatus Saccharibacteria bacterium]|nr:putative carboxyl-terminal protease [Candidatus Saccharibacteria bacterium]